MILVHRRYQTAKNEKELEGPIQTIRKYRQDIEIEFGIENCGIIIMKRLKEQITKGNNNQIRKELERLEKRKITDSWEYFELTSSCKRRRRKNDKKSNSDK